MHDNLRLLNHNTNAKLETVSLILDIFFTLSKNGTSYALLLIDKASDSVTRE
jgi:hypothetical protein